MRPQAAGAAAKAEPGHALFGRACLATVPIQTLTAGNGTRQWSRANRRPEWNLPAGDLEPPLLHQALTHFFRTGNLIALRELALRFVADESDEKLLEYLRRHQSQFPWETTERIMVAVTAEPGTDVLLRRAARLAFRVKAELDVVHVIADDTSPSRDGRSIGGLRALAADLGARWHEIDDDDPARALVSFAREHQITQIVIGSVQSSWWHIVGGGPVLRRVIHEAGALGIDVHVIAHRELPPDTGPESSAAKES